MPNWCSNRFIIFGNKDEVLKCYLNWCSYLSEKPPFKPIENSWKNNWIGNLFRGEGWSEEEIHTGAVQCRGGVEYLELQGDDEDGEDMRICLDTETAWNPNYDDMIELIGRNYNSLDLVMVSEEPGCEIYINTDTDGKFFTDKYMIEGHVTSVYDEYEYFTACDEDDFVKRVNELTGKSFKSVSEVFACDEDFSELAREANHLGKDDECYLSVHEYTDR